MPKYKDTIVCWLNENKKGGLYLTVNDIEKNTKEFYTMHKFWVDSIKKAKQEGMQFPKVPMFSKSVKVEDESIVTKEPTSEEIADSIPF